MSYRLYVTRVVNKAKVIKHWYAQPAKSDISIAELFSQLRDGDIDGRSIDKKYIGCQAVAVFKFWGPGPFFICGALRVNVENSWGSGGGRWKFLDFDPIQAILGPSGITLGDILQADFEDMGGYFFGFDLIKTILGTPGTTLRHLTEYFWTFRQMH